MALKLHNLKPGKGSKKRKKRLGRGDASGKGSYSGRGLKGQRARSGGKGGLKLKGFKANIQNIPKLPGFKSLKPKLEVVNLKDLDKVFKDGEVITPVLLKTKGLVKTTKNGIKILGQGKLNKKLTIKANKFSNSAKEAIEKAGGKVIEFAILKSVKKVKKASDSVSASAEVTSDKEKAEKAKSTEPKEEKKEKTIKTKK